MAVIYATSGEQILVDDEDMELLRDFAWRVVDGYARAWTRESAKKRKLVLMHRLIMGANSDEQVDHRERPTTDNRKSNLRKCSHQQNMCNRKPAKHGSTGYKGVFFESRTGRYTARIVANKTRKHLGTFNTPEEAARTYDSAALAMQGEFARTNAMLGLLCKKEPA